MGNLTHERMVEIDPSLSKLSFEELDEIRVALYETAQLGFEVYWSKKHGFKNLEGSLTPRGDEATL
jgi:hypothetical protein